MARFYERLHDVARHGVGAQFVPRALDVRTRPLLELDQAHFGGRVVKDVHDASVVRVAQCPQRQFHIPRAIVRGHTDHHGRVDWLVSIGGDGLVVDHHSRGFDWLVSFGGDVLVVYGQVDVNLAEFWRRGHIGRSPRV